LPKHVAVLGASPGHRIADLHLDLDLDTRFMGVRYSA
jgi:hypothetical protein